MAVTCWVGCRVPSAAVGLPVSENLPPAQQLLEPGPGVGGPGPGVMQPQFNHGVPQLPQQPAPTAQVLFAKPDGMQVQWDVGSIGSFDSTPLIVPGRFNFPQGGIYRLKITNIDGRPGVELYPTLEIGPTTPRTSAYLAHNAIPVQFTEEDFDQVLSGNFVTKVIYLPDPEFQELALADVDTLVSTRLDPGVDPIVEADRRGAILAIIRVGNKDEEMPTANGNALNKVSPVGFPLMAPGTAPLAISPTAIGPGGVATPMPPLPFSSGSVYQNYISGVTAPPWGIPLSGTPIGLPGPPHIPLGGPAGLQQHLMHNHTQMCIPGTEQKMQIHVQQSPGLSYPAPANDMYIKEQTKHPTHINHQPPTDMVRRAIPGRLLGLRN